LEEFLNLKFKNGKLIHFVGFSKREKEAKEENLKKYLSLLQIKKGRHLINIAEIRTIGFTILKPFKPTMINKMRKQFKFRLKKSSKIKQYKKSFLKNCLNT